MLPLPPPSTIRHILSFDFDGTLHNPAESPDVPVEFFEVIRQLREDHGCVWGINTGRELPYLVEGLADFPFLPDWVVTREHEIFHPMANGLWRADEAWNQGANEAIHHLFRDAQEWFAAVRDEIESHTGARWLDVDDEPAGIVAQSDEEMGWVAARVEAKPNRPDGLIWQRNSIWLRFAHRDFQKGSALAQVARSYGLTPEKSFAAGDSHNDFQMLHPDNAAMIACPANAVEAIKAHVKANGGYQASQAYGHGTIEALRHFF